MVIPIDAVRTGAGAGLTAYWARPAAQEAQVWDWNEDTEPATARGIAVALLLSAILWAGLFAAGRALAGLL
ncbi:MAG TPA: hypothetical protein VHX37_01685 [Acidobacteriaceae bacterium]|jgi:hypothetical protein|nr:hypothetical protein [Acidobacteriaceae bacterium]